MVCAQREAGFAVQVMEACSSLSAAADLLGLDWWSLRRMMERAVERGLSRRDWSRMDYLGLDEKSFRRGQSYVTNAVAEGHNSKIQAIKHAARGFRDFHYFRLGVHLKAGGLNLHALRLLPTQSVEEPHNFE